MRSIARWIRHGLAAALVTLLAVCPAALAQSAGPPTDYTKVKGLSKPVFQETVREQLTVPMRTAPSFTWRGCGRRPRGGTP